MVKIELKGLYWSSRKRVDGSSVYYYRAWKNGPLILKTDRKLTSATPELVAAFQKAHEDAKPQHADNFVAGLIINYKSSPEWRKLADRTRKDYSRWLDEIHSKFGTLPVEALDDKNVRKLFIKWRDQWETTPRKADHAINTLKALLSWSVGQSIIDRNRASGIKNLYSVDKSNHIWSQADIEGACQHCSIQVQNAINLMAFTGLRLGDAVELRWDQIKIDHIERPTNKSGKRRIAYIPLLPETRSLLDSIPRQAVTVLTTTRGLPWAGGSGLSHAITDAAQASDVKRTTHDLRRTFATRLAIAGVDDREIAEIMGWSINSVTELRRVYVDRSALIVSLKERLANKSV